MRFDDDPDVSGWRVDPGHAPGLSRVKIVLVVGAVGLLGLGYACLPLDWIWSRWFGSRDTMPPAASPAPGGPLDLADLKDLAKGYRPTPPPTLPPVVAVAEASVPPAPPPDTSMYDALKAKYDGLAGQYDALNARLTGMLGQKTSTPATTQTTSPKVAKVVDPAMQKRADEAKRRHAAMLGSKTVFLTRSKEEAVGQLHALKSPYSLAPSETIPCTTAMAISSDTPGAFVAIVSSDVKDTATRTKTVIPKGSKFVLKPRNKLIFGDARIDIEAETLTFPSGPWMKLGKHTVTDAYGTSGMTGEVDRHLARIYGSVLLTSILRGGTTYMTGGYSSDATERVGAIVAQDTVAETTRQTKQFANTSPTITVKAGVPCSLILEEEVVLTRAYPPTP